MFVFFFSMFIVLQFVSCDISGVILLSLFVVVGDVSRQICFELIE